MKLRLISLIIVLLLPVYLVYAQAEQGEYLKMDYLHINMIDHHEFLDEITHHLADLKERRIADGEIKAWHLYSVVYPGYQVSPYNFVSVTVSEDVNAFDFNKIDEEDFLIEEAIKHKYGISRSELWRVRNCVHRQELTDPSIYVMMDFMNVAQGREFEYLMLEDEVARPLHEERMKNNIMDAWEMYELIIPGGLSYGYNYMTANYFSELGHIEFGFNEELIRSSHPETNIMEFFDMIRSARDLVISEVWRLKMSKNSGDG